MLSALTGTCILTERVGSVQDAGFFTGGNFKSEAAKSISGDGSDGSEDPKVRFDAAAAVAMKDRQ